MWQTPTTGGDLMHDTKDKIDKLALDTLNIARNTLIINLRFGLNSRDGEEMTQKEVADIMGISQSYISRLEKKIIASLKKEISNFYS